MFRCLHNRIGSIINKLIEVKNTQNLIDILEPTPQTVEALMKLDLASGVDIEIKI